MSGPPDLATLQAWLAEVLEDAPSDWQVTPESLAVLAELQQASMAAEAAAAAEVEEEQEARAEYQAEIERYRAMLAMLGGLEEEVAKGPGQAYLTALVEACLALDTDTAAGTALEAQVSSLLVRQAEVEPRVAAARAEVARGEREAVELYSRLARVAEAVEAAGQEARAGKEEMANHRKKTDFTLAKVDQYRKDVERGEALLARNGASDKRLRHSEVAKLRDRLREAEATAEPLRRELGGFLELPPSADMARVEVAARRAELEQLELEVQRKISSLHV